MNPPAIRLAVNHRLLFALAALSIAAPSAIPNAVAAATPPDDEPMETMQLVTDQEPATDPRPQSKAEAKIDTGALIQRRESADRQPGVRTTPMIEMDPVGRTRRAGEVSLVAPPIRPKSADQPNRDRRVNRFGLPGETTSTRSTHPPRPTYPVEQPAPAQIYKTIRIEPIYTTARTAHPVNRRSGSSTVNADDPLNDLRRRDVVRDFVNESSGNVFVGFGRNNYVRRPKYEHRSGFGADYRNIRTNQNFFALPRHGGGQDLFDPRRGRVIHGIKRRDGSVDYYDPVTGRWILTQERRR